MEKIPRKTVRCDCGAVELRLEGDPRVRAICHCRSCQDLLHVPFNRLGAWEPERVSLTRGSDELKSFKYPGKQLRRFWCGACGAPLYDTNRFGYLVFSQALLRKSLGGELVSGWSPDKHLFYSDRVVDVDDDLPKYLEGIDGALYEG